MTLQRSRWTLLLGVGVALVLAIAVAYSLGAFTSGSKDHPREPGVDPAGATGLVGTWQPVQIPGYVAREPWPDPSPTARISFDGTGHWRGSDGCNGLGGTYTASPNGAFQTGDSGSTDIGCANVPNGDVLSRARSFAVKGTRLTFVDPNGSVLGRYVLVASG